MSETGSETARTGRSAGLLLLLVLVVSVSAWQMFLLPREAEASGAPALLLAEPAVAPSAARARSLERRTRRPGGVRSVPAHLIHPGTVAEPAQEVPDAEASRRNRLYEFVPLPEEETSEEAVTAPAHPTPPAPEPPRAEAGGGMPWFSSIDALAASQREPAPGEPETRPASDEVPEAPAPRFEEDSESALEQSVSPESGGLQLVVLGPPVGRVGDLMTFSILLEDSGEVAHAPLRIQFDPDVLEYVIAREGPFFRSDGADTQFYAMQGGIPGQIDVALSRVPPAGGISGNGTLCELTFRAIGEGESPVVLSGSRLMDTAGYPVPFRRNDIYVAIQ